MKHALHCKFCKKPITVEIDDAYLELGDPYKLLPMALCNHCADLRVRKRQIEARVKSVAMLLIQCGDKVPESVCQVATGRLHTQTQDYAKLIADWHNMSGMAWDEGIPGLILSKPDRWADILAGCWKHFKASAMPRPTGNT